MSSNNKMKFSSPSILILVALVCVQSYQSGVRAQINNDGSSSANQPFSLLNSLISPIRETLRYARNLFGHRVEDAQNFVNDNFDLSQKSAFTSFMRVYNKTYLPAEIPKRIALFLERRKEITESVLAFSEGRLPFMMRENPYIDWDDMELKALAGVSPPRSLQELTEDERKLMINRNKGQELDEHENEIDTSDDASINVERSVARSKDDEGNMTVKVSIPAYIDWRQSGCVAEPLNQEMCGCCYAIATIGMLEARRCISKVSSPILSPQQIIDCSTPKAGYQNFGCDGGWPTRVLKYLQDVGLVAREKCYPFKAKQSEFCKFRQVHNIAGCSSKSSISDSRLRYKVLNNERDILYHVGTKGPVVTVMKAVKGFLYYGKGIFDDPSCSRRADDVDHAILIVGYGRENGVDYWIIKNSWGTEWGLKGYGKYKRGTNVCSIGHWGWAVLD